MNKVSFKARNFIAYALGALCIAFGVVFMLRSSLGTSTWDTLHYALSIALNIELGDATIVVAIMFTIAVVALNKQAKYLFMAIPVVVVGQLINFVNLILLKDFAVDNLIGQVLTYGLGIAILPLGGALLIISTFPAGVFDEFNLAVMKKLHSEKLVLIRVIMEITAVSIAFVIGQFAGIGFGTINVGTLIFALTVGIILKKYLKLFERLGLYNEDK